MLPLAGKVSGLRPDSILCSDLKRCHLLAEVIAARLGLFAEPDPIWREVSFGTWENQTWSDIQASEPQLLDEWMTNFDTVAPPAGESFEQLQARVLTGIEDKILGPNHDLGGRPVPRSDLNPGETSVPHFLVVTHAGVIRAARCAFSNLPLRKAFELPIPYGSYTSFCWDAEQWSSIDPLTGRTAFSREGAL